jgi:PAS domain S-box-containing protein
MNNPHVRDPVWPRYLVIGAAVLGVAIVAGLGFGYYRVHLEQVRERAGVELHALSSLKADEIRDWLEERKSDARTLAELPGLSEMAEAHAARPDDAAVKSRLMAHFRLYEANYGYTKVVLFGADQKPLLVVPEGAEARSRAPSRALLDSVQTGSLQMEDLWADQDGSIHLEVFMPVLGPPGSSFRGTLMLCSDPRKRLFPILRQLSVRRSSLETILIRTDGDHIDYLSPLRSWGVGEPTPDTGSYPTMDARMLREEGTRLLEVLDYRGEPVMGRASPVPGTPWLVFSKIDRSELLAPVVKESKQIAAGIALIQIVLGLGVGYWWRERRSAMLATQTEIERSRAAVAERLGLVMRHANDVILLLDSGMRIVDANERVQAVYGRSAEATKGLHLRELRAPSTHDALDSDFERVFASGGLVFDTLHRRVDGTEFPVEVSSRPVDIDGQPHALSVIRDITDRQAHEREIIRLGRLYLVVSHIDRALVKAKDPVSMFEEICEVLVEEGGFRLAMVGWLDPETNWIRPVAFAGEAAVYAKDFRISADGSRPEGQGPGGRCIREARTQIGNDYMIERGTELWRERAREAGIRSIIGIPLWRDGVTVGTLLVYAGEVNFFQEQEVVLLESAARDISFALDVFARDEQRRKSEEAVLTSFRQMKALQAVAAALEQPESTPPMILQSVVRELPGMFRFPARAGAAVEWNGQEYRSGGSGTFVEQFSEDVVVNGRVAGRLTVGYVQPVSRSSDGVFSGPERETVAAIARTLGLGFSARESFESVQHFNLELEEKVDARTAELEARRRELQALLDAIPDMVVRYRRDGTVLFCRETAEMKHVLCSHCPEPGANRCGMSPAVQQACVQLGLESLAANHLRTSETVIEREGVQMSMELRAAPVTADEFVLFIRDITERKHLEAEREAMLAREREVSEMKTRFISVASHEFRTPMAAILGSVELLSNHLDRLQPSKRQELFGRIGSSVERMRMMLDDVLTLNRMEAQKTQAKRVDCDLVQLVGNAVEEVRLGDRDAHRFEFESPKPSIVVPSDSSLLHHIVSNLLSNAVRYSPAGSSIRAFVVPEAGRVRLVVEDEGIGIPEADRGRIFEPFERGSNVGTVKGTGLGLNIVKRMTELLGGTVAVEDGAHGGCRFTVTLPCEVSIQP